MHQLIETEARQGPSNPHEHKNEKECTAELSKKGQINPIFSILMSNSRTVEKRMDKDNIIKVNLTKMSWTI